ncbi:hypothetical protein D3C75_997300 [compost metagenome]
MNPTGHSPTFWAIIASLELKESAIMYRNGTIHVMDKATIKAIIAMSATLIFFFFPIVFGILTISHPHLIFPQ